MYIKCIIQFALKLFLRQLGMPLYGQSFTINDPKAGVGLNVPASAGNAGEFTRAAGFLAYYEICNRIRNHGWTVVQDPEKRMGPYAYKGSQWVSFDDADSIRRKAQFVRNMNLGGGMVWALDLDDFRGRCEEGPHPLMHTLQQVLSEPPNQYDKRTSFYAIISISLFADIIFFVIFLFRRLYSN